MINKLIEILLKKYVRIFPYYKKAVICKYASKCARSCPCDEEGDQALVIDFECNYGNEVT